MTKTMDYRNIIFKDTSIMVFIIIILFFELSMNNIYILN